MELILTTMIDNLTIVKKNMVSLSGTSPFVKNTNTGRIKVLMLSTLKLEHIMSVS